VPEERPPDTMEDRSRQDSLDPEPDHEAGTEGGQPGENDASEGQSNHKPTFASRLKQTFTRRKKAPLSFDVARYDSLAAQLRAAAVSGNKIAVNSLIVQLHQFVIACV
jgi:hypothetical protein